MGYFYLALSILAVTAWALFYKVAAHYNCETRAISLFVFISATAVSAANFYFGHARMNTSAAALGAATGVASYLSILTFFLHMRKGVLSISWTLIGMSIALPVLASILFWNEHPTPKQYVGLCLIPVSILLCNYGWKKSPKQ